jgi:hypothetical protein
MKKCKTCKKECEGKYCSKRCEKKDMMREATEKVCKSCGKPISRGKYCKKCEKEKMAEGSMSFKDLVKAYLTERKRGGAKRGVKAMASRAGLSPAEEKREAHKLEGNGTMAGIKKRAHSGKVSNPNAYIFGTEAKIMKQHAAKMKRGG